MLTLITVLYILFPVFAFLYINTFAGAILLTLELISLCLLPVFIKAQKCQIALKIKEGFASEPILNINKAPWFFLVELPEVSQFEAKKMVYLRKKYGKYASLEDFYIKNQLSEDKRNKIEKYIFI